MGGPRALVTGANGFIGSHIVDLLLEKGIFVQAVVRSEEKVARVKKDFPLADDSRLGFSIVPDISAPGAFDKCIQESLPLDVIIHTASPFNYSVYKDPSQYLGPALQGTLEILSSTLKYASGLKRLVITGSFSAIGNPLDLQGNGTLYTSDSWNPLTMEQATSGTTNIAYWGSKTFAERAAWDFMDKEKPPFELVVLNPPVVYGPIRHSIDSIDDLNTSNQHLYKTFMSSSKTAAVPKDNVHVCIDVRDLAVAHYLAAFAPNVGNRRYFVTRESNTNQEICDILRETLPERDEKIPLGTSGNYTLAPGMFRVDNSSSKEILGLTYRPFKETIADSARCFLELEKKLGPGSQSPPVTA